MDQELKGIVDSLRVAATYVPGTVEGSVMDKAAETIETLEAEVREQKNQSIRHLGICELRKQVETLKATIASQGKELTQWAVEGETLRSKLTEKKRECIDLRGDLLQKEAEFRQLLDISEALAKR